MSDSQMTTQAERRFVAEVTRLVSETMGVSQAAIAGHRRPQRIAWARQIRDWLVQLHLPRCAAARALRRDRTSLQFSRRQVRDRRDTDPRVRGLLAEIEPAVAILAQNHGDHLYLPGRPS